MFAEQKVTFCIVFICSLQISLALSINDGMVGWDSTLKDNTVHNIPDKIYTPSNETGPLSAEILNANPRLEYIGDINSKSYYAELRLNNWDGAGAFCDNLGMHMARFDSDDEKNFVYQRISSTYGEVWTAAKLDFYNHNYQFYWEDNGAATPHVGNWYYYYSAEAAKSLVVDAASPNANVYLGQVKSNLHNILCYI